MSTTTVETIHERDEWSEFDGVRWGLAKPPILGEVSSEERPAGPVSKRLLVSTAASQRAPKPKRLPRIWTPESRLKALVPRSERTEADSLAAEIKAASRRREKQLARRRASHFGRAAAAATSPEQKCRDCGVELCDWGIFDNRPVLALRHEEITVICRKCNGGRDPSPEAVAAYVAERKIAKERRYVFHQDGKQAAPNA